MATKAATSPTQPSSLLHTALIVIAAWGLFAMPITYTGGASLPHPHSFVQFLREAETGTMSHHAMRASTSMMEHVAAGEPSKHAASDESVENAPLASPPSYGIERLSLVSVVQPAAQASIFVLFAAIWLAAIRLTGRAISPLIPPPRWIAVT